MGITNGNGMGMRMQTRLNLGVGIRMAMNHWEWEGIGFKKSFPLISITKWADDTSRSNTIHTEP